MLNKTIRQARIDLQNFLKSSERKIEIEINCPAEDRIRFIYSIIFPGWKRAAFYWRFLIARIAGIIDYSPIKVFLYRCIGMKIGKGVFISPGVVLDPHFPCLIEIGDHAIIGWGAALFTHDFSRRKYSAGRIKIGRGAVIGGFCIVRGGVTVGENAEAAAACIVYKDVPPDGRLAGGILLGRALANSGNLPDRQKENEKETADL